jgi:methylated-DNA-[protein]-cysteine S-methyltransferase
VAPEMLGGSKEDQGPALLGAEVDEPVRLLMASPVGRLGIEFRGEVVTRLVVQPDRREAKLFKPLDKVSLDDFLLEALGRLSEYFAGVRPDPEIEVDLESNDLDDFARRVLREVRRIPSGRTWSYKRLAEASGRREAYNRVRSILSINPIPILVPCHRVVPNKGGAGAWIGGTKKKEKLLKLESGVAR